MRKTGATHVPPLARASLSRDVENQHDPQRLAELLIDAETRFVVLQGERMLGRVSAPSGGEAPGDTELALFTREEAQALIRGDAVSGLEPLYLGKTLEATEMAPTGTPLFAMLLEEASPPEECVWLSLRDHVDGLSDRDAGVFTTALALARWHESAQFSPSTGSPTHPAHGGWMRIDPESGAEIFPRTDPAVIVLITDADDRVLLGSHLLWPRDRYSLLAGFVEAGESLEAAVYREIQEEAGIRVTNLQYRASQPWPFPRSLMVGFRAELAQGEDPAAIRADETELADLRWFSRAELLSPHSGVTLPGAVSIARFLLDEWLSESEGNVV